MVLNALPNVSLSAINVLYYVIVNVCFICEIRVLHYVSRCNIVVILFKLISGYPSKITKGWIQNFTLMLSNTRKVVHLHKELHRPILISF